MATTYVGGLGTKASGAGITTVANTYAPTSGNLLVVVGSTWSSGGGQVISLSDTRGNTIPAATFNQQLGGGNAGRVAVWLIPNCTGGAGTFTLTSTVNPSDLNLDVLEYSGASPTAALDGTPVHATSVTGTSLGSGNITTSTTGSFLVVGGFDGSTAHTASNSISGFNQRLNTQNTVGGETSNEGDVLAVAAAVRRYTARGARNERTRNRSPSALPIFTYWIPRMTCPI